MRSETYDIYGQDAIKDDFSASWGGGGACCEEKQACEWERRIGPHLYCRFWYLGPNPVSWADFLRTPWAAAAYSDQTTQPPPGACAFLPKREASRIPKAQARKAPQRSGPTISFSNLLCNIPNEWHPEVGNSFSTKAVHFTFAQLPLLEKSCWLRDEVSP